jgi:hypothetical protein
MGLVDEARRLEGQAGVLERVLRDRGVPADVAERVTRFWRLAARALDGHPDDVRGYAEGMHVAERLTFEGLHAAAARVAVAHAWRSLSSHPATATAGEYLADVDGLREVRRASVDTVAQVLGDRTEWARMVVELLASAAHRTGPCDDAQTWRGWRERVRETLGTGRPPPEAMARIERALDALEPPEHLEPEETR